jgi:AsmA family protein
MRALRIAGGLGAGLLIIITLLLGALAIGGGAVLAWLIEHPLSRLAGCQILVDGPVSIRWGGTPRLVAENIHIANARWGSRPDMFTAQRAEITVDPLTLLGGPWTVAEVQIERAMLLLETGPNGQGNWDFARTLLEGDGAGGDTLPRPGHITVRGATFIFRNGGAERVLVADSFAVDVPDAAAPITLRATGTYRRQPLLVSGSVGSLDDLRHRTRPYPVALEARIADSDLVIRGTAREPRALAGIAATLSLSTDHLDELAAAFGLALPPLPEFRAAGELTGGDGEWAVTALTVKLGQSDIEGGIALSTRGVVPYARADLSSSVIDLGDLAGLVAAARSAVSVPPTPRPVETGGRVIPAATVPAPRISGIDVDVSLHGARVAASKGPPLEDVVVALRLKDGVLALDPLMFSVAGGQVALDVSVNPTPQVPELALGLDIHRVDLAELARWAPLPPFAKDLRGIAGGFMRVRSAGVSLRDVFGRMEGEAGIFAENGAFGPALQELLGRDVLDALGLDGGMRAVPVSCLISRFDLQKGVVTASTLLLDTPGATLLGQGTINFGAETIYVDITPHQKQVTPAASSAPVEVRGTYAGMTIRRGTASVVERAGTAIEPGILPPPPALRPLADVALGENNACATAFGTQKAEDAAVGSSRPPKRPRP